MAYKMKSSPAKIIGKLLKKKVKKQVTKTVQKSVKTKHRDMRQIDVIEGKGSVPTTRTKIETYQDIKDPSFIHQIKYSDQGIKGGTWKPFVGELKKFWKAIEIKK